MSSSNSFNTCPRCANSNSLNAKYCSRCGAQLKVPSEAVVCHKCHTRNSSLANFCRNCGATLKVGAQTKICPRCGREIGAEENMCACGYSFVTLQQTEPRRADVSSTNRDKKDKKRDKGRNNEPARVQSAEVAPVNNQQKTEKKPKQKKGGRGFALFAFLFLAVFVVLLILPVNTRGPLAGFDKGIFRPNTSEAPKASAYQSLPLYAEGDEEEPTVPGTDPTEGEEEPTPAPVETWTVTFKNGTEIVKTVTVVKGEKLTADQIPADLEIEGKEFKGWWFNGKTQATAGMEITMDMIFSAELLDATTPTPNPNPNPNPTPDPEPTPTPDPNPTPNPDETETRTIESNIYGWDLIQKIIGLFSDETKAAMGEYEGGKFKYIVNEYFGTATFIVVVMFALFIVTAVFHLLVCIIRIIAPRRSRHSNLLFLILAVCTTVLVILMFASQAIKADENAFKMFFAPMYNGLSCSYGYVIALIPIYYWFFWLYSCIAKKKMPKKTKKNAKGE